MDQLPEQNGANVSVPAPPSGQEQKPLFEKHLIVAFVISLAILGLIFASYLLFLKPKSQAQAELLKGQVLAASFQTEKFKEYIVADLDKIVQLDDKKDTEEQFKLYSSVFDNLLAEYTSSKNSQFRVIASDLKNYLADEFAAYYQEEKLKLPCVEVSCGQAVSDERISDIRTRVNNQVKDQNVAANIEDTFERAGWLGDDEKLQKFNQYINALASLENYAKVDNRAEIQETINLFKNYLRDNFSEYWASYLSIQEAKKSRSND